MKRSLFAELKRRHVYRVAVAYAVVGWLLVEVASQLFPFFRIPNWSIRFLVFIAIAGFPIALVLAWAFELTPEGVRRTEPVDSPEARPPEQHRHIGRKLDFAIITVLALALGFVAWQRWGPHISVQTPQVAVKRASESSIVKNEAAASASPAIGLPSKSIAVLPLVNDSSDKNQQYFSDGLSENLIMALSQFHGLKVIGRNSAFQFRHSKLGSREIGAKLGVAHLLEGSVQHAGDEVRVNAELINAADGSTLWSQRYDRPYKDLFKLQDEITGAVATALKAKLLPDQKAMARSERPPSGNLAAYNAYLQAKFHFARNSDGDLKIAIDDLNRATQLDPQYAVAWAFLAQSWTGFSVQELGGAQAQHAYAKAREAADKAVSLAPNLALAHIARGHVRWAADFDWYGAEVEFRRALTLAPDDADAKFEFGRILAKLGHLKHAVELTREVLKADPLNAQWYKWLGHYLNGLGRLDEAEVVLHKAIELQPGATGPHSELAIIEIQRGNAAAALTAAQGETPGLWRDIAIALARQIGGDRAAADAALKNVIEKYSTESSYQVAEIYAARNDADNTFVWLDRAWANRDPGITGLLNDPLIDRFEADPRFAAICHKVRLPVSGAR